MRVLALPEGTRKQMDADPEWAESFLGPEPDLSLEDTDVWATYWTARRSNPSDAMGGEMALDLVRAIDLHERLHGGTDAVRLADKLMAMDGRYLGERKRQREEKKKGED